MRPAIPPQAFLFEEGFTMTSFVHTEYPSQHPGVVRAEQAAETIKNLASGFNGARGAATLLLSAVVAALLVVANQVVDTWTEGHLLMAWIVMWTIAFAALALLAAPARNAGSVLRTTMRAWTERRKQATADARLWELALTDARVMADISRAMTRDTVRDVRGYY
jgi:hypothetical protein